MFENSGGAEFPFPAPVVLRAATAAVANLKGFKVLEVNELASTITIATGVSLRSWGEKVRLSVAGTSPGSSQLMISSELKTAVGALTAHGANRNNVDAVLSATTAELQRNGAAWTAELGPRAATPVAPPAHAPVPPAPAAAAPPPPPPPGIPAGWHPDPSGAPLQRYWDGTTWTEHTAPLA